MKIRYEEIKPSSTEPSPWTPSNSNCHILFLWSMNNSGTWQCPHFYQYLQAWSEIYLHKDKGSRKSHCQHQNQDPQSKPRRKPHLTSISYIFIELIDRSKELKNQFFSLRAGFGRWKINASSFYSSTWDFILLSFVFSNSFDGFVWMNGLGLRCLMVTLAPMIELKSYSSFWFCFAFSFFLSSA